MYFYDIWKWDRDAGIIWGIFLHHPLSPATVKSPFHGKQTNHHMSSVFFLQIQVFKTNGFYAIFFDKADNWICLWIWWHCWWMWLQSRRLAIRPMAASRSAQSPLGAPHIGSACHSNLFTDLPTDPSKEKSKSNQSGTHLICTDIHREITLRLIKFMNMYGITSLAESCAMYDIHNTCSTFLFWRLIAADPHKKRILSPSCSSLRMEIKKLGRFFECLHHFGAKILLQVKIQKY